MSYIFRELIFGLHYFLLDINISHLEWDNCVKYEFSKAYYPTAKLFVTSQGFGLGQMWYFFGGSALEPNPTKPQFSIGLTDAAELRCIVPVLILRTFGIQIKKKFWNFQKPHRAFHDELCRVKRYISEISTDLACFRWKPRDVFITMMTPCALQAISKLSIRVRF